MEARSQAGPRLYGSEYVSAGPADLAGFRLLLGGGGHADEPRLAPRRSDPDERLNRTLDGPAVG
jgi:hypothetical protein